MDCSTSGSGFLGAGAGQLRRRLFAVVGVAMSVAAGVAHAAPGAFNVVVLPRIPNLPPSLRDTGAILGTGVSGGMTLIDPVSLPIDTPPFFKIQTATDSYESPMGYVSVDSQSIDSFRETFDGRDPSVATTAGFIISTAVASPGKLRAQALAGGGGGSVDGAASATAMFVDTITLVRGGGYTVDWDVHGSVTGGYSILTPDFRPLSRPGASARIRTQVWWVPYEVDLLQAAQTNFLGCYWESTQWQFEVEGGVTLVDIDRKSPDFGSFPFQIFERDGTKFWVVGVLEVYAYRSSGSGGPVLPSSFVTGEANFMNTVRMTIDSYNFPGEADVISASGHDYSVPPPPCAADFNADGFLTFEDFDAFVESFEIGESKADFDGDGFITFEDFDAYVASFEVGC
jgi:hypothetical protein